ncbi:nitroreductase family protein [Sphingobium sp. PNB]|uniref:nitroreductase family protein n=1 Tax=Sphingobium sp. PNB TaxID=863934 RepID=UPI001CA4405B|nr:nitroreductase family protein [Sphingobium sp. PNB]MCB4859579.1 nitroreductase family protein [Sphingobium sp. PNB]
MSATARVAIRAVEPLFLDRWSPRAFDSSLIPQEDLDTIFEGARWAPSAFNYQPWRLLYATRDSANWSRFLGVLLPFNQSWVQNASVLLYILSDTLIAAPGSEDFKPSHSHSFDAGAAWALLALQATRLGYHAHAMSGVDFDKARVELAVPDRFRIEAAVAIGRIADKSILSESLQAREVPSGRKDISEFVTAGNFPA